jgi:MerR family copper efflux transcriptional regulator
MAAYVPWSSRILKIGDVSRLAGMPVKTIRFYCDQGVIHPNGRSEGRYRIFDESVIDELSLVQSLKMMEFPLVDIKLILEARRSGFCNCSFLKSTVQEKINAVDQKINDLRAMQQQLIALLSGWRDCGGIKADAVSMQ